MAQRKITNYLSVLKKSTSDLSSSASGKLKLKARKVHLDDVPQQKRIKCWHGLVTSSDDVLEGSDSPAITSLDRLETGLVEDPIVLERRVPSPTELEKNSIPPASPNKKNIDICRASSAEKKIQKEKLPLKPTTSSLRAKFAHLLPSPDKTEVTTAPSTPEKSSVLPHLQGLNAGVVQLATRTPPKPLLPRYHHRVDADLRVPLPRMFEHLDQVFDALDYTVAYMLARHPTAIFHRMVDTVQYMSGRTCSLLHLRHILAVFPDCYTVQPVRVPVQGQFTHTYALNFPTTDTHHFPLRRRKFREHLIQRVMAFQNTHFNDTVSRWHPDLDLAAVPMPDPHTLPTHTHFATGSSPADLVQAIHEKRNAKALKGTSTLLERIRAKEAHMKTLLQTNSKEITQKKLMLSRLYVMASTIKSHFAHSAKSVIPLADLAKKVSDSYPSPLNEMSAVEHIELLADVAKEWLHVVKLGVKNFVKVHTTVSLTQVKDKIDAAIKGLA